VNLHWQRIVNYAVDANTFFALLGCKSLYLLMQSVNRGWAGIWSRRLFYQN